MRAGHHEAATEESRWRDWLRTRPAPPLVLTRRRRAVVVSAHPDDDVLAVGGLLQALDGLVDDLTMVVATDGEASHPDSAVLTADELRVRRPAETGAAIRALGLAHRAVQRLRLPDSGLADAPDRLHAALQPWLTTADLVLAPLATDGHPDHDAVGRVAADLAPGDLWAYPVWAWHWSHPEDARVPWASARAYRLEPLARQRKAAAVRCFETQLQPAVDQLGAVVPPAVLAHFERDVELVLVR